LGASLAERESDVQGGPPPCVSLSGCQRVGDWRDRANPRVARHLYNLLHRRFGAIMSCQHYTDGRCVLVPLPLLPEVFCRRCDGQGSIRCKLLEPKTPVNNLTLSSDRCASCPDLDPETGRCLARRVGECPQKCPRGKW